MTEHTCDAEDTCLTCSMGFRAPLRMSGKSLWLNWATHSMGRLESDLSPSTNLVRYLNLFGFSPEESQACGPAVVTGTSLLTVTERESRDESSG